MMVYGAGLVYMVWSNPEATALRILFASVFGLAVAGFWPWVIFVTRRKQNRRD